jgi:hypothetical protein
MQKTNDRSSPVNLCNTQNTSVSITMHPVNENEVTASPSFSTKTSTTQNLVLLQEFNPPAEAHSYSHSINIPHDFIFYWPCILLGFLVNDQVDAQFFSVCLFQFSTCFEQPRAHRQENQLCQYNRWCMSLCVDDRFVCRSDPSSGIIKRASLKLLVMFCLRSRCLAAWNLDLWCVCLQAHETVIDTEWHTPAVVLTQLILLTMSARLLETCRVLK